MLRLRRSSASLHSGSAQQDTILDGTEKGSAYFLNTRMGKFEAVPFPKRFGDQC